MQAAQATTQPSISPEPLIDRSTVTVNHSDTVREVRAEPQLGHKPNRIEERREKLLKQYKVSIVERVKKFLAVSVGATLGFGLAGLVLGGIVGGLVSIGTLNPIPLGVGAGVTGVVAAGAGFAFGVPLGFYKAATLSPIKKLQAEIDKCDTSIRSDELLIDFRVSDIRGVICSFNYRNDGHGELPGLYLARPQDRMQLKLAVENRLTEMRRNGNQGLLPDELFELDIQELEKIDKHLMEIEQHTQSMANSHLARTALCEDLRLISHKDSGASDLA